MTKMLTWLQVHDRGCCEDDWACPTKTSSRVSRSLSTSTVRVTDRTSHRTAPIHAHRDTGRPLCRIKCGKRSIVRRNQEKISGYSPAIDEVQHDFSSNLTKRRFTNIDDRRLDIFLYNRFRQRRYNVIRVFENGITKGNSAEFRAFGDAKLEMGVEELCGCTVIVVISASAVWFAHLW